MLTLGSGGSSFLIVGPFDKAGLLSMIAIDKCFVNDMLAAIREKIKKKKKKKKDNTRSH